MKLTENKINAYLSTIMDLAKNGTEKQKLMSQILLSNPRKAADFIKIADQLD